MKAQRTQAVALLGAVLMLISSGLLAGFFAAEVSILLYFVLLFPVGQGLIGAVLLAATLNNLDLRGRRQTILLGMLLALTMYAAYQYTDYWLFRLVPTSEMQQELLARSGAPTPAVAGTLVDYALQQETGSTGWLGFLRYQAKTGISFGTWYGGVRMHLGPALTWFYWTFECTVVAWVTVRASAIFSKWPR